MLFLMAAVLLAPSNLRRKLALCGVWTRLLESVRVNWCCMLLNWWGLWRSRKTTAWWSVSCQQPQNYFASHKHLPGRMNEECAHCEKRTHGLEPCSSGYTLAFFIRVLCFMHLFINLSIYFIYQYIVFACLFVCTADHYLGPGRRSNNSNKTKRHDSSIVYDRAGST